MEAQTVALPPLSRMGVASWLSIGCTGLFFIVFNVNGFSPPAPATTCLPGQYVNGSVYGCSPVFCGYTDSSGNYHSFMACPGDPANNPQCCQDPPCTNVGFIPAMNQSELCQWPCQEYPLGYGVWYASQCQFKTNGCPVCATGSGTSCTQYDGYPESFVCPQPNCSACSPCPTGEFILEPCEGNGADPYGRMCVSCNSCPLGQYVSTPCNGTGYNPLDRACMDCQPCLEGQYIAYPCQPDGLSPLQNCSACNPCPEGQETLIPCSGTGNDPNERTCTTTTSTTATTTVTTTAQTHKIFGCFQASVHSVWSLHVPDFPSPYCSLEYCGKMCAKAAFPVAGVTCGTDCFCGNTTVGLQMANMSFCKFPCSGDRTEYCGGIAWDVYSYFTEFGSGD